MNVTNQDGFPPGVLTDFVITEDGTIQGQFSNGVQRTLGTACHGSVRKREWFAAGR